MINTIFKKILKILLKEIKELVNLNSNKKINKTKDFSSQSFINKNLVNNVNNDFNMQRNALWQN